MHKLSVIEAARSANAFRRDHWREAAGPLALIVLATVVNAFWPITAQASLALVACSRSPAGPWLTAP